MLPWGCGRLRLIARRGSGLFDRRYGSLMTSKPPADDVVSIYWEHADAFVRPR